MKNSMLQSSLLIVMEFGVELLMISELRQIAIKKNYFKKVHRKKRNIGSQVEA